ncbi:echinoderm microtubule-associated protein-like CG42247 isoform X2 [Mya arenaria]|uniref:echinoderm microtubule-associated protein-like CG42247 isoform X2 n=1 Tax=Mya arenaria TaxID=6604 RepID=UPI0022E78C20|nr:echinoderm microtubule-associated protein-like CG42247 isoform X2 [Mya arenaria]
MAKTKSKIPIKRPLSEDERSLRPDNLSVDRQIYSSRSFRSRQNDDDRRNESLEIVSVKSGYSANDENVDLTGQSQKGLKVRRQTVTIKDARGNLLKRRQSYKLSYDPNRPGGNEYEIEAASVGQTANNNQNTVNDILTDVSNKVQIQVENETDTVVIKRENDDREFRRTTTNTTISSILFTPKRTNPARALANDVQRRANNSNTATYSGSATNATADDVNDNRVLGETYPLTKSTIDRSLLPTPKSTTNVSIRSQRSPKESRHSKRSPILRTRVQSKLDGSDSDNDKKLALSTKISKEDTNNSLPPPNFKASLFNRVRKLSTPRKSPKFKPVTLHDVQRSDTLSSENLKDKQTSENDHRRLSKATSVTVKTENTFVKEPATTHLTRFERLKSSQSVRSHYDKTERVDAGTMNGDGLGASKIGESRYEHVEDNNNILSLKPKRHKRTLNGIGNASTPKNGSIIGANTDSRIPKAKDRSVAKVLDVQKGLTHSSSFMKVDDKIDIYSESDKKVMLKHAQYISDDLKIMKSKLKDNDFIVQHLNAKTKRQLQKNAVLRSFKINKNKHNISSNQTVHSAYSTPKQRKFTNKLENKRLSQISVERKLSPKPLRKTRYENVNVWKVQPKIHHYDPHKNKHSKKEAFTRSKISNNIFESRTNNVASWVLDSVKESRLSSTMDAKLTINKPAPVRAKKQKRKRLLHEKERVIDIDLESKSSKGTNPNLISAGMYLPITKRKLKRKPMRLKNNRRLYTQVGKVKGYESEIPILYSDEEGEYPEPRPLTDTDRSRYPNYRRYEDDGEHMRVNYRDPAHKKVGRTCGALVKFFRNGDSDFKGLPLTVNRNFRNLETLLVYLNDKVPTSTGVHYIFKWPEGTEIKSVTEFQNRCVYIVSSTHKLVTNVNYGQSREDYWSNKKPSAGRLRKNELELYKKPPSPRESPVRNSPLIVTIINNLSRDKREKVILNPQTQQTFEKWLEDISNPDMPVYALFSEKPPHVEINSFSALFRELRTHSNFLAVGEEGLPAEVAKKRQAPSSNSSTDSIHEARNRKKKLAKQQEMGQIYENGRAQSPTSTAMSRYDYGPRYLPGTRGRSKDARRNIRDSVEIEIDGNVREFIPPSFVDPEDDGRKPDKNLKCEWVYGFRGRDARHNLLVLPETGELVYFVASVVVLYNKERDTQRHYIKHNEEITCMTIHPNQYLIATGQMHGKGPEHASHIRIWHGVNLSTYSVIGVGVFYGEILSIGFSNDGTGNFMCVIDGSEKHVLSVWEWQTEKLVARTTTSTDPVHCACFYPDGKNNSILITYGARHIYFWKIFYDVARRKEAKILRDRNSGIFEDEIPKSINCLVFLASGDVVTGDSSGNLLVWDRDTSDAFTCRYAIQAHQGSVASVCLLEDGTLFSASGSEVKAWDTNSNFRAVKTRQIPQEAGGIRSLVTQTPGGIDGKLYIGTTRSAILDGSLQLKFRYIVQGHSDGILGVVPHPFEPTFISAGMDQIVYKWSLVTHKVTWRSKVEAPCTSAAVDQRHELIAVGMSDGTFTVLNSYNGMHITTVNVGAEPIGCLAFSPDGCNLALGTNDGLVIVFTVHDRGQAFRKVTPPLTGHTSGVAHVDWSTDGRCIQSSSYTHELLFWDIDGMQQIRMHRLMRDVDWFTSTCHVQYGLIGPWSNLEKGETVKVVNRSNFRDTVITGDSKGRIRLYKYPCSKEKADFRGVRVYSSDVTAACFTPDTRTVITCGGHDAAMVQWTLVDE